MSSVTAWIDRRFYPGISDRWDAAEFRKQVLSSLAQFTTQEEVVRRILDLGAGAGSLPEMDFSRSGATIYGCDIDPGISKNHFLHHATICDATSLPYRDNSFDLIFSCNVLEHIQRPEQVFKEIVRILKPGGVFLAKTPNRRHYVTLIARLTPFSFHRWINKARGRRESDTFPTYYRANTDRVLRKLADAAGLHVASVACTESRPEYCRLNPALYLLGTLYGTIVNSSSWLECFRVNLVLTTKKLETLESLQQPVTETAGVK